MPTGANAAIDVAEILLEHFDRETKITAEVVKLPFALSQTFDDLLTPGAIHLFRSAVLGVFRQPLVNRNVIDVQFLDHTHTATNTHAD